MLRVEEEEIRLPVDVRGTKTSVLKLYNVNSCARARLSHGLRDVPNVCALTKVGTVLKAKKITTVKEVWIPGLNNIGL